jgi:hypothetical protein
MAAALARAADASLSALTHQLSANGTSTIPAATDYRSIKVAAPCACFRASAPNAAPRRLWTRVVMRLIL